MKDFKFTLKPRFMPYLINEDLDRDPVTKEKLYSEKFMGKHRQFSVLALLRTRKRWSSCDL